jgi:hypothetical protein
MVKKSASTTPAPIPIGKRPPFIATAERFRHDQKEESSGASGGTSSNVRHILGANRNKSGVPRQAALQKKEKSPPSSPPPKDWTCNELRQRHRNRTQPAASNANAPLDHRDNAHEHALDDGNPMTKLAMVSQQHDLAIVLS